MKRRSFNDKIWLVVAIAVITVFIAFPLIRILYIFYMIGPPRGEKSRARDALDRAITSIDSRGEFNDLVITTNRWYKLPEFSEDFVSDYNIVWQDYTWGAWEFVIEFPKTGKQFYFDLSYYPDTSKWRVYVKPVGQCLKPRFQINCLLPEYRRVSKDSTLPGLGGVRSTYRYKADPNIVVDKDEVRSRIMNALSEDGWQPMLLPDQNSLKDTYEMGPNDLYYSYQPDSNDSNVIYIQRIYISGDAKTIVIYLQADWD
jgi:hypothetical protein